MKKEGKQRLPYNADIGVLDKIISDLKTTGQEGLQQKNLWDRIGEANNKHRSYTLNLTKYLGLVESDSSKVWLSKLGASIGYMSAEGKNEVLISNLPEEYMTMTKWLVHSPQHQMYANDIKAKYVSTYGNTMVPLILDRSIACFLKYAHYIGLVQYGGKGRGAKAILTDFGKQVLERPGTETSTAQSVSSETGSVGQELQKNRESDFPLEEQEATLEGEYPIRIITRERTFDWDLKIDADLKVLDSVIEAVKENWKERQKNKKQENAEEVEEK